MNCPNCHKPYRYCQCQGIINPMLYGAVGDGIADDTAAVQAAFNGGYLRKPAREPVPQALQDAFSYEELQP